MQKRWTASAFLLLALHGIPVTAAPDPAVELRGGATTVMGLGTTLVLTPELPDGSSVLERAPFQPRIGCGYRSSRSAGSTRSRDPFAPPHFHQVRT